MDGLHNRRNILATGAGVNRLGHSPTILGERRLMGWRGRRRCQGITPLGGTLPHGAHRQRKFTRSEPSFRAASRLARWSPPGPASPRPQPRVFTGHSAAVARGRRRPRGAEFDQRSQAGDEISRQPTPDPADDAVGAWPTSDNRGSVHQSGSGLSRQSKMPTRKRTLKRLLPVARGMNRSSCYSRL